MKLFFATSTTAFVLLNVFFFMKRSKKTIKDKSDKDYQDTCVFCNMQQEKILYQTENVKVFSDRTPKAWKHYLIVPTKHIKSIKTLDTTHLPILLEMKQVAKDIIDREFPDKVVHLGFHNPPFYSIPHLHLHLLVEPFKPRKKMSYTPHFRGLWYKNQEDVINSLYDQVV